MSTIFTPNAITAGMKALLVRAMRGIEMQSLIPMLAQFRPTNVLTQDYSLVGDTETMEVVGDGGVIYAPVRDDTIRVTSRTFARGIKISQDSLRYDQTGQVADRINRLARAAVAHANSLLITQITNGTTYNAALRPTMDDVAFFHTAHPIQMAEGATQSNIVTQTGVTTAAIATDFATALSRLQGFVAHNSEPYHENPSELLVLASPDNRRAFLEALTGQILSNTSNVQASGLNLQLHFTARLTGNPWYLSVRGPSDMLPLAFQESKPVSPEVMDPNVSDESFDHRVVKAKVEGQYEALYNQWQSMIRVA